jgi:hypothetical protein
MRIGLFVTCLTDTLYPGAGRAVVTVLERLGHQVDFPAAQSCCGQMHFNTGMPSFPVAAATAVADSQLRRNLAHATHTIREKRAGAGDTPPRSAAELDQIAGVVTGCAVAIAETGTIILDH